MTHLVYHDLSGTPGQLSPFDQAALRVCNSGIVGLVSPYIGLDYLRRIIGVSENWRLISDIEAWLSSLSMRARPRAWRFIRENLSHIRHCPSIHAKVIIGQNSAMLGSANLTSAGILGRTEMGILIDNLEMVAELTRWFDTLWLQTHPPVVDETNAFIRWLDEEANRTTSKREKFALSVTGMKIRARLSKLSTPAINESNGLTINIQTVAQGLIFLQQKYYATLNEALEYSINDLAANGFVFKQILEHVRQKFPDATIRETYFALLQHCANHVRSVFSENTKNRLILADGRFKQSTKESLLQALTPFDSFLTELVRHFEFTGARNMPDENQLENLTGIRGEDQTILVSELLNYGLLEINDIAGHLPLFNLSATFEWDNRYKLFKRALINWNTKKSRATLQIEKANEIHSKYDIDHTYSAASTHDFLVAVENEVEPLSVAENISLSDFLRYENVKMERAERVHKEQLAVNRQIRTEAIDKILAHLLLTVISGEKLPPPNVILADLPTELSLNPKWVQKVLNGEESDVSKIILTTKKSVVINPSLEWRDIADFPLTQEVCKNFLGM